MTDIGLKLLNFAARMTAEIAAVLKPLDITPQQLKMLSVMATNPDKKCTVNVLKEAMADPMSNVSRMLNKMEAKGLVKRLHDKQDRRVVLVQIKPQGMALLYEGKILMDSVLARFDCLSESDVHVISRMIDTVSLSASAPSGEPKDLADKV